MIANALTVAEATRRQELEGIVDRGLRTFLEVGAALAEIRDARLYRDSHDTWQAYCRERWGFSDRRARQLMSASAVVRSLAAGDETGTVVPLSNEAQARELGRVPEADRVRVWEAAAELAGDDAVTARHIRIAGDPFAVEPHPYSLLMPPMPEHVLRALTHSVAALGLLEPIHLDEGGRVLDGKYRLQACEASGVAPRFEVYRGDAPAGFVWSLNICRRHLTADQVAATFVRVEAEGRLTDPLTSFVWAMNVVRRHLTEDQRAVTAVSFGPLLDRERGRGSQTEAVQ